MKLHPSITIDRLDDAIRRNLCGTDNPGFCIACGHEQESCEPDAERYPCDECGERQVYGAAEIAMQFTHLLK